MKLRRAVLAFVAAAVLFIPVPVYAQGCAQCRDNTAATSPATQRAYRHAIILMAGAAAAFFVTTVALLRKSKDR